MHRPEVGQSPSPEAGILDRGRIPSLDGLRGVAIVAVLLQHAWHTLPAFLAPLGFFLGNGGLGVSVFFLLSGFLIYSLSVREYHKTNTFNCKQFYIRRTLRIFPCFYFYVLVVLALAHFGWITVTDRSILAAATFTLNYRHLWDLWPVGLDYPVIGHYWTLALEEQFYLMWPLLMLLFVRRSLSGILIAFILLAPLVRVASYFLMPGSRAHIGMMFHTGFDSIAAGVLLGELLRSPQWSAKLQQFAANRAVLAAAIIFPTLISPLLGLHFEGAYLITVGKTLDIVCIALVLTAAVSQPKTRLFNFLNWRPLAFVGVLSYSLYIWNNLFLMGDTFGIFNTFPLNLLCVMGIGLLSYFLLEKPFLKLKDYFHKPSLPNAVTIGKQRPLEA
ncbi:MAG TPA: acyltransferase [Terrimicrobiaceae bacterium]